jgi:hypothetical protein
MILSTKSLRACVKTAGIDMCSSPESTTEMLCRTNNIIVQKTPASGISNLLLYRGGDTSAVKIHKVHGAGPGGSGMAEKLLFQRIESGSKIL